MCSVCPTLPLAPSLPLSLARSHSFCSSVCFCLTLCPNVKVLWSEANKIYCIYKHITRGVAAHVVVATMPQTERCHVFSIPNSGSSTARCHIHPNCGRRCGAWPLLRLLLKIDVALNCSSFSSSQQRGVGACPGLILLATYNMNYSLLIFVAIYCQYCCCCNFYLSLFLLFSSFFFLFCSRARASCSLLDILCLSVGKVLLLYVLGIFCRYFS